MVAVAVVYGSYRLSGEIEASRFPLIISDPTSGVDIHYCADAAQQPTNLSFGTPCERPLYMTCQLGGAIELAGETPISVLAESGLFEVPDGFENATLMSMLGFSSESSLGAFVQERSSAEYLASNPKYYACSMAGANSISCGGSNRSLSLLRWQAFCAVCML